MANGVPAPAASILDTLNSSISGLEEALNRLDESMLNDPRPTGLSETNKGLGLTSRKLNALQDLVMRVDYVTAAINRAASELHQL